MGMGSSIYSDVLYTDQPQGLVAAIDFGTTYSGYAYADPNRKNIIVMNNNWGAGFQSFKAPTCVLLDKDSKLCAFGYKAQKKYARARQDGEDHDLMMFENFKLELHQVQPISTVTRLQAFNGQSALALDVFAAAIEYLKRHLLDSTAKQYAWKMTAKDIKWVITVPAIWSFSAKQFMREAAKQAGLIESVDSPHLVLAYEPEAASLHCKSLSARDFQGSNTHPRSLAPGTKYIIMDAGGGTVDVTAHEILADGGIREIIKATGGAMGGIYVDERFEEQLTHIVGAPVMGEFKKDPAWIRMMTDFERTKRLCTDMNECSIEVEHGVGKLADIYYNMYGVMLQEAFVKGEDIFLRGGEIVLTDVAVRRMYQPVVSRIATHIADLLMDDLKGHAIDFMYMVGGFSECPFLREEIEAKVGNKVHGNILVPSDAMSCIMQGAVKFGLQPRSIRARISPRTYGTGTNIRFRIGQHDSTKKKKVPTATLR